ncbi:MAG: YicC/YloC family endoribonuclease [Syntrophothermus sp.]
MIVSMTGFGKTVAEFPGKKFTIEIRSLNNKGIDINLKMPAVFRDKEPEIRTILSQRLERGKVDILILPENTGSAIGSSINKTLAQQYYLELRQLQVLLKEESSESILPLVLRMPDVLQVDFYDPEEGDWSLLKEKIIEAVDLLNEFRQREGKILAEDIISRVRLILNSLEEIGQFEDQRILGIREKMRSNIQKYLAQENLIMPGENRFEQEMIFYLERLDITEEKIRLKKHCDYFLETLDEPSSQGKKLGFISQEMGREINTIGSKANDAAIQKIVVGMKDELEKIKEQLLNIL